MSIRDTRLRAKLTQKILDLFGEAPLDKASQARANKNDQEVAMVKVPVGLLTNL